MLLTVSSQPWIYAVAALFCFVDGFFPPIPSEALAAVIGASLGDNLAYLIGRRMGVGRFAWMRRPVVQRAFARAGRELDGTGLSMILVARFVPVALVAALVVAGLLGVAMDRAAGALRTRRAAARSATALRATGDSVPEVFLAAVSHE